MKAAGYKLTKLSANRYRLTRGTRHSFVTLIDGVWRQTTKDGAPAGKKLSPKDFEAVVTALGISSNCG